MAKPKSKWIFGIMLENTRTLNKYINEDAFLKKVSNFLYSDWFLLCLSALVSFYWTTGEYILGIVLIIVVSSIILVLQRDVTPIIPLLLMATATISVKKIPDNIEVLLVFLVPLIAAIIFHIVHYRNGKIRFGRLFLPLIAVTISCVLGGLFSTLPKTSPLAGIYSAAWIGLLPLAFYLIVMNFTAMPEGKSFAEYIAKGLFYFGLIVVVELAVYYLRIKLGLIENEGVPHLGWGISNTVATILLFSFPMGFYLSVKTKGFLSNIYIGLAFVQYIGILLTTSRGATIVGSVALTCALVSTIFLKKGRDKISYIYAVGLITVFFVLFAAIFTDEIKKIYMLIFHDGFNDSGRFKLYKEAWECFKAFPIFGAGLGFDGFMKTIIDGKGMYFFHNTIMQVLGSLGIVGVLAYGFYYIVRVKMLFQRWDIFNLYVIIAYIGFEGYSMLNTGTFQGFPFCTIVAIITATVEINSNLECDYKKCNILKKRKKDYVKA